MPKTSVKTTVEWNKLPWHKLERRVFKLQTRIYKASQRGDVKAVRKLQKILMRSWSSKCLAVRRVTQDNQGKKTAGVDGIKSLSPVQRSELVKNLKLSRKAKPTRRVWIPNSNQHRKRKGGTITPFGFRSGDFVQAEKAGQIYRGWIGGYTQTEKSKNISAYDVNWKRIGQFSPNKVKLLKRSCKLCVA